MAANDVQIAITSIETERIAVPIRGTSPLIVHKFSEKSKRQMLDNMQGRKTPKEPKDPEAEFEAAMYYHDNGDYGFPVIAFKSATVGGARFYGKSVSMTALRQFIFFDGDFSKVDGQKLARITGEPIMREDVVRVGMGGTDLRYRPEFTEWSTTLDIVFVKSMLTRDSVLSLVEAGGMGVGVGEWRPEKKGDFGTYEIDRNREIIIEAGR